MIPKPQLLSIASENGLLPTTVEKDYTLGWLLAGISRHPELSHWIFKGGTCLKKCFFETYRFSEDLDFTVPADGLYTQEGILKALGEVASTVTDETGIQFPPEGLEVKESINKRKRKTFVAKLTFIGPLNQPRANQQRIKFDITQDEVVVDGADLRPVFHPYSDAANPQFKVKCYTINEVLAEKTRALYERLGTPRDVFDVVNIGRNFREDVVPVRARAALVEKFKFKALPDPSVELVLGNIDPETIQANWAASLGHQLRILPPAETFLDALKESLEWWIEEKVTAAPIAPISTAPDEASMPRERFVLPYSTPTARLGVGAATTGLPRAALETIRFAARNRLKVAIQYSGVRRIVEPYSLRRPRTGNTLLYVFEVVRGAAPGGGVKALNVNKIGNVEVLAESFQPRYIVEL